MKNKIISNCCTLYSILMLAGCSYLCKTPTISENGQPCDPYNDSDKYVVYRMGKAKLYKPPESPSQIPKDKRKDYIQGFETGWKEKADNYYFVFCPIHKEITKLYTPKDLYFRKSKEFENGYRDGWNKADKDAATYLKDLEDKLCRKKK